MLSHFKYGLGNLYRTVESHIPFHETFNRIRVLALTVFINYVLLINSMSSRLHVQRCHYTSVCFLLDDTFLELLKPFSV